MDFFVTTFSCIDNSTNITENCTTPIGFYSDKGVLAIFILSIIGFILNCIFLLFQCIRLRRKKKTIARKISMRKLLQILPLFDSITAIYWIISSYYFKTAQDIDNNQTSCELLSIIYLVFYTFQFVMINFILLHFRRINLNPLTGILKPYIHVFIYLIISIVVGLIVGYASFLFEVIGRSPMNTCFIHTNNEKIGLFFFNSYYFYICSYFSNNC